MYQHTKYPSNEPITPAEPLQTEQKVIEPFDILAIGDSVMWGQGLRKPDKFYSLVENYIKTKMPGLQVNKPTVLAHSGAIIGKDVSEPLFRWNKVPGEDESKLRVYAANP